METPQAGSAAPKHCKAAEELGPLRCPSIWLQVPGTTEGRELAVPNVLISRSAWKKWYRENLCAFFKENKGKAPISETVLKEVMEEEKKKYILCFKDGVLCLLSDPDEGKAPGDVRLAGSCTVLIRASPALLAAQCPPGAPWPSCSQPWRGGMQGEGESQQYHSTWDAVPQCHCPCPPMRQEAMH